MIALKNSIKPPSYLLVFVSPVLTNGSSHPHHRLNIRGISWTARAKDTLSTPPIGSIISYPALLLWMIVMVSDPSTYQYQYSHSSQKVDLDDQKDTLRELYGTSTNLSSFMRDSDLPISSYRTASPIMKSVAVSPHPCQKILHHSLPVLLTYGIHPRTTMLELN